MPSKPNVPAETTLPEASAEPAEVLPEASAEPAELLPEASAEPPAGWSDTLAVSQKVWS